MEALVTVEGAEPWSAPGSGVEGETGVVVVHGFTGNPIATRPLGQRLARDGYAVEVVLLPGHGTSYRDLGRTRYADWFECVDRAVTNLASGCERIVLVGHSVGGTLCLDLASRRPEEIAGVAVINPLILDPDQALAKVAPLLQHVIPYVPRDLAGLPTDDICRPGVEEGSYKVVSAKASQSLIVELPRVRAQLADLVQPLLVASSSRDHTVPPRNSEALVELVGGEQIRRIVLDRSYHVPMIDYDATRLEESIAAFVAEVATG